MQYRGRNDIEMADLHQRADTLMRQLEQTADINSRVFHKINQHTRDLNALILQNGYAEQKKKAEIDLLTLCQTYMVSTLG